MIKHEDKIEREPLEKHLQAKQAQPEESPYNLDAGGSLFAFDTHETLATRRFQHISGAD